MRVPEERVQKVGGIAEAFLEERRIESGAAARFCGKLQFAFTWAGGRFGRAVMQPLFAFVDAASAALTPAAGMALRFVVGVLPELPPHVVRLLHSGTRPALVWSDGAYEQLVGTVGFLLAKPRPGARWPPEGASKRPGGGAAGNRQLPLPGTQRCTCSSGAAPSWTRPPSTGA